MCIRDRSFTDRRAFFEPKNYTAVFSYVYEKTKYEKKVIVEVEKAPKKKPDVVFPEEKILISRSLKLTFAAMAFMVFGFCLIVVCLEKPKNKEPEAVIEK